MTVAPCFPCAATATQAMVDHAGCPRDTGVYPKLRLLDRVRDAIRARHYSRRTEKAYVGWIKRYIFFHAKRHPADMHDG